MGREKSIAAVEWAMANNSNVFLVAQKSMDTTEPVSYTHLGAQALGRDWSPGLFAEKAICRPALFSAHRAGLGLFGGSGNVLFRCLFLGVGAARSALGGIGPPAHGCITHGLHAQG